MPSKSVPVWPRHVRDGTRAVVRVAVAVLAIAMGSALLLAPQVWADDPPVPIVTGSGDSSPVTVTELSATDLAEAEAILANDEFADDILNGQSYTVDEAGPWTTLANDQLGAVLHIQLSQPTNFSMTDWPAMVYDENATTPPFYETDLFPASATDVTEFTVQIDLDEDSLVGMFPGGDDIAISPGSGVEVNEPTGE